jgi:hypothetical protein
MLRSVFCFIIDKRRRVQTYAPMFFHRFIFKIYFARLSNGLSIIVCPRNVNAPLPSSRSCFSYAAIKSFAQVTFDSDGENAA